MLKSNGKRGLTDDDIDELRYSDEYLYYEAIKEWPETECESKDDCKER